MSRVEALAREAWRVYQRHAMPAAMHAMIHARMEHGDKVSKDVEDYLPNYAREPRFKSAYGDVVREDLLAGAELRLVSAELLEVVLG